MPRALSLDLRERVLAAVEAEASCRQAAERFGVGVATAIRWQARFRAEGEIAAKPMGGDQRSRTIEAHVQVILQACEAEPQAYLRELRDSLRQKGVIRFPADRFVMSLAADRGRELRNDHPESV